VGLGRRTFAPGEVLTASNVMNYLMDQSVMNFAGTAARGSAIGTAVSEGMVSYLADTDSLEVYRTIGTASPDWNPVAFESYVNARSGLVPITPSSVNVGSGTATIGANGKVSLNAVGTNVSLNGVFSSTYEHYRVLYSVTFAAANTSALRFRAAGTDRSSSLYDWVALVADATGPRQVRNAASTSITIGVANTTLSLDMTVFYPASSTIPTRMQSKGLAWTPAAAPNIIDSYGGYSTANAEDGLSFILGGSTVTGTVQVFGFN
jgi:hypothetical protein